MEPTVLLWALLAADGILMLLVVILLLRTRKSGAGHATDRADLDRLKSQITEEIRQSRMESNRALQENINGFSMQLQARQEQSAKLMDDRLRGMQQTINDALTHMSEVQQQQFLQQDTRLQRMQESNARQLDEMRQTVDEKLQKTLNDRITQSFQTVNQRLQEVYAGLGEMKTLASGVGDLKKVLSNVKTRGIVGEYQLAAIIEELLPNEQYEANAETVPGSGKRVEFAVRLPGEDGQGVYLPIDSKFPGDLYHHLVDAYDKGDPDEIATAKAELERRIKSEAKEIHEKYVKPPHTTEFAILFLPFEGLYAEVVRSGLLEELQQKYRVNIAGPTTLSALLNSLQMGFRTLAIQKRSGEVWQVLSAVKTEFATFETVLQSAQKRIEATQKDLDKLVGVRTRQINQKLRAVSQLPAASHDAWQEALPNQAEASPLTDETASAQTEFAHDLFSDEDLLDPKQFLF